MKAVPFGADNATIATAPRATVPRRVEFAVTRPRSPGPSGLQARRIVIPLVAKSLNAVVAVTAVARYRDALRLFDGDADERVAENTRDA